MICPKCGAELPDNSKICGMCGEKIVGGTQAVQEEGNAVDISVSEAIAPPTNASKHDFVQLKNKFKGFMLDILGKINGSKKIISIAITVIIVVAIILGLKSLFSSSVGDNAYAYLSNGKYELITNLNKDQTIEIASSKSDKTMDSLLSFSPDGKYIYYYTKYDENSRAATLCRAEYWKLKENSKKNDKYIEIIGTNVSLGFRFLEDNSILYENSDRTLYYFNGDESVQIAKNVNYYFNDEPGKLVYSIGDYSEGNTLYGVTLSDLDNKIKLVSNYNSICSTSDFGNILYTKSEDDGSETLYVVGFTKEAKKIAEKVTNINPFGDKIYFTAQNGAMLNLYDFVEDNYADSDAGISEPNNVDFSIPKYSYEMIKGGYNLSETDFDELYTTCTKELYWYGESTWWSCSMVAALRRNWGDNTEEVHAATKSFIEKFGDTANADGYIKVTDEVKAALLEIQKYSDNPEREWQWLWLCYNKYQSGTTIDYDAYYAASDKWTDAKNRISIRNALKNEENDYPVKTLYCYENGSLKAVDETVLSAILTHGAIEFNTTDTLTDTIKIENVSDIYDVQTVFFISPYKENSFILEDGTICKMSTSAAEDIYEATGDGYKVLYFIDKDVYMSVSNGSLYMAKINGGIIGDFSLITDDATIQNVTGSTLYYVSNSYQNNNVTYCDVYSCTSGSSSRLARDVILENVNIYTDDVILAYSGYRNNYGYELTMINSNGETSLINDNVTQYIRVDKSTLLYISDGDLYVYNGKEKKLLRSEVKRIWSLNSMQTKNILGRTNW